MKKIAAIILILVLGLGLVYVNRVAVRDLINELQQPELPAEQTANDFNTNTEPDDLREKAQDEAPETPTKAAELPASVNLAVPFTIQAPHQNWALPYQEACEEASLIMAHRFYTGQPLNPDIADEEILKLVAWQEQEFGEYKDTDAPQNVEILQRYFGYKRVELIYDFTAEDIRENLAAGRPVILPAAGRQLGNPYFTPPGPFYHMLVIKGYTEDGRFITNDPGTRRGADYVYSAQTIINAAHDWNDGDAENGKKVIIIPYR
ncbi:hypothetical protein COV82_00990 [Candidatus Peregrinibacteria bacterium CG11_big_fil_rev_8_21_14_0_20_46_8]|nr:MAG: hypothetical protein COV82_00990 [Candidatus Peregrinibacteria bacterium CG11_big_fil_rev_8_21_14_0_20_46_8]